MSDDYRFPAPLSNTTPTIVTMFENCTGFEMHPEPPDQSLDNGFDMSWRKKYGPPAPPEAPPDRGERRGHLPLPPRDPERIISRSPSHLPLLISRCDWSNPKLCYCAHWVRSLVLFLVIVIDLVEVFRWMFK